MDPTAAKITCSRCGIETRNYMGGVVICDECYIIRGSCCPEFGPDDLSELNAKIKARSPEPSSPSHAQAEDKTRPD